MSQMFLMEIVDFCYRYLKQGIAVWASEIRVSTIFNLRVDCFLLYYKMRETCVCKEKCFCPESPFYINPSVHLWILVCAFIHSETP